MKQIIHRVTSDTPKFFRKLRNIGLAVAGIGAAILAAPLQLPTIVIHAVECLTVAGGIMSGVSQATVLGETE
jgi:hypothetical protein